MLFAVATTKTGWVFSCIQGDESSKDALRGSRIARPAPLQTGEGLVNFVNPERGGNAGKGPG